MSPVQRLPSVEIVFGDGDYLFCLPYAQVKELQQKTGVGLLTLFRRIASGDWLIDDLREVIRLAAIGGGLEPVKALELVKRYVDPRPKVESARVAAVILDNWLRGVPDDPIPKSAVAKDATAEKTGNSASPRSTDSEPSSGSRPPRSIN